MSEHRQAAYAGIEYAYWILTERLRTHVMLVCIIYNGWIIEEN